MIAVKVSIPVVNQSKTLEQSYTDALVRLRDIDREEQAGESVCSCCEEKKSDHCPDGRCSSWVCSRNFTPRRGEERRSIVRAIELLEELRGL